MPQASNKSRQIAELRDRRVERLARIGTKNANRIAADFSAEVLAMVRSGGPMPALTPVLMAEHFGPLIRDAMRAGHMGGRLEIEDRIVSEGRFANAGLRSGYEEAIEFLDARLSLTPAQVEQLIEMYSEAAILALADAAVHVERAVSTAIATAAREGKHLAGAQEEVRAALARVGLSGAEPWLVENLTRTQLQIAFSAGRLNALQDPDVDPIVWGYEYVTVGDDRVRPSHQALNGFRAPKDDPRWSVRMPPNGFNCRCSVVEIFTNEESRASLVDVPDVQTIDGVEVRPEPDEGFDFNPVDVYQDMMVLN